MHGEYVCSQLEFNKVFLCAADGFNKNKNKLQYAAQDTCVTVDMHAVVIIAVVGNYATWDLWSSCGAVK